MGHEQGSQGLGLHRVHRAVSLEDAESIADVESIADAVSVDEDGSVADTEAGIIICRC